MTDEALTRVHERIDQVTERVTRVEVRQEGHEQRLAKVEQLPEAVAKIDKMLSGVNAKMGVLQWLLFAIAGGVFGIAFEVLKKGGVP
jgi:DNA-binding ferritin-like protein